MRIHDCDIFVNVCGEGPCVVLLHGWGQSHHAMEELQKQLCDAYCVVNLDLPGFGESEKPHTAWSIEMYADCLYDLLGELQCQNPILIAHSFGARIALCYAHKYDCRSMVLTGAAGIMPERDWKYHLRVVSYKLKKHFGLGKTMGSADYRQAEGVMREILVKCVNQDCRSWLPEIQIPVLLVWGKADQETPLWMGKTMAERMPYAHLIEIEGGHFAYQRIKRFPLIVRAFLQEVTQ